MGNPQKGHGTSGSIMGWSGGTPPPGVNRQTDRQTNAKTLPSLVLRTRAVKMKL